MALTLYTAKDKQYVFQVIDLVERATMDASSKKEAKRLIRERPKEDARQYKERMEGVQLILLQRSIVASIILMRTSFLIVLWAERCGSTGKRRISIPLCAKSLRNTQNSRRLYESLRSILG